jgi:hypothetical protein
VPINKVSIFYPSGMGRKERGRPADWSTDPARIDDFTSYVYLGTNNIHGVLAYEKPELWKSSERQDAEVAVLLKDFSVQYLPLVKLREWLHGRQ